MANGSQKYIKNIAGFGGGNFNTPTNTPAQYASRQTQYMADRTRAFDQHRAYLSTDFFTAQVQGLNLDCFYDWETVDIRLADIVSPSATASKKTDDYKHILFPDMEIEYFPIGAKVVTAGNTWLCVNPSNISSAKNTAVVARCNASYNSYDFYGNVVTEPIVVEKYSMLGNDNENPQNLVLMDGYFNITCQLNENTRQIKENSRIILGTKAYHITGVTDFVQEFTADRSSCHIVTFTARVEETTDKDDITFNFIANGNEYTFTADIQAPENISVGQTASVSAIFVKNGIIQADTDEYPIAFDFVSADESVATIDENGTLTPLSVGSVAITAILRQNTAITATVELLVKESKPTAYIEFTGVIPKEISQYESVTINARYFENGTETTQPLVWVFGGATTENYSYVVADDGLSVTVECLSASETPLEITASYNGQSVTTSIELQGY